MYTAPLDSARFFDSGLLLQLAKADSIIFNLSEQNIQFGCTGNGSELLPDAQNCQLSVSDIPENCQQLVVVAEALNLEKLQQVQTRLSEAFQFYQWQLGVSRSSNGVVAKASVIGDGNDEQLNSQLDAIAVQQHIEIALLDSAPALQNGGLVVFDMDSTLIQMECIDEIAALAGVGDKVSAVTELAMQGKLDFTESLYSRVACLEGVEVAMLQGIRDKIPLMPGLTELLHQLQNNGWKTVIASGGFTYFADYLKTRLNMYEAVSNVLEVEHGRLTGKVVGTVVNAQVKADTLRQLAQQLNIEPARTLAVGDGANDLVMMAEAGLGIAYHAKPLVRQKAGAAVRFGGLDTILDFLN